MRGNSLDSRRLWMRFQKSIAAWRLHQIEAVQLREGLLDLELHFSSGLMLQIIPDSSGYESWELSSSDRQFIAVGGGELVITAIET
jgi:hypothetical protein